MPPFLAIFMSVEGAPLPIGLFTEEEFHARYKAAEERTSWAVLLDSTTGLAIYRHTKRQETK